MFKLVQIGPAGDDCTALFDVRLNGPYTVETFIHDVLLDSSEWGRIGINDGYTPFGNPSCEFSHGVLKSNLPEEYLPLEVVSARASGGWSNMNYRLTVKPVMGEFYKVTDHYGIRPEDSYRQTIYMVYKVAEVSDGKGIAAFRVKNAAINECRYLERLNSKTN